MSGVAVSAYDRCSKSQEHRHGVEKPISPFAPARAGRSTDSREKLVPEMIFSRKRWDHAGRTIFLPEPIVAVVLLVAPTPFQPHRLHRPVESLQRDVATIDGVEADGHGRLCTQAVGQ